MPRHLVLCTAVALLAVAATPQTRTANGSASSQTVRLDGLTEPVEILRDRWGINHIYARTERDLFFAQGYAAARDRLFQFELWRRQAIPKRINPSAKCEGQSPYKLTLRMKLRIVAF